MLGQRDLRVAEQEGPRGLQGSRTVGAAYTRVIQGLYWSYIRVMGYILGLYRDNGKENGKYYRT